MKLNAINATFILFLHDFFSTFTYLLMIFIFIFRSMSFDILESHYNPSGTVEVKCNAKIGL